MDPLDHFYSSVQEEEWRSLFPELYDVLHLCPDITDVVLWNSYSVKSSPPPPPPPLSPSPPFQPFNPLHTLTPLTPVRPPPPPPLHPLPPPPPPHHPLPPPPPLHPLHSLTPLTPVRRPPPPLPPLHPPPHLSLLYPPPLPPLTISPLSPPSPPLWCGPAPPSTRLQSDSVPFLTEGNPSFHPFGERDWDGVVAAMPSEALEPVPVPKKRKREVDEGKHVKKPPNAFMLFLKSQRTTVQEELGIKNSAVVNKVLSERWKSLTADQREVFQAEAKAEARVHALNNPGWSTRANYGKNIKRSRTKAPRSY